VWGRRGKKLQSKIVETTNHEMGKLIGSKDAKGYCEIPEDKLHEVYPEFQQDLEKTAAWSMLMA
jgi:predicted DNA-binding WGR domain protein